MAGPSAESVAEAMAEQSAMESTAEPAMEPGATTMPSLADSISNLVSGEQSLSASNTSNAGAKNECLAAYFILVYYFLHY
jgi:hypothetical protein